MGEFFKINMAMTEDGLRKPVQIVVITDSALAGKMRKINAGLRPKKACNAVAPSKGTVNPADPVLREAEREGKELRLKFRRQ